jgi:hypothetical protein
MAPSIRTVGAYPLEPTPELFSRAIEIKYGELELGSVQRADIERVVREELANIVLLELSVEDRDDRFDVGEFGQPDSDQAPYDERFLSEDGSQIVAEGFDVPTGKRLRCVFFLHNLDTTKPLKTSYGDVQVPQLQPMPDRLLRIISYEPVD